MWELIYCFFCTASTGGIFDRACSALSALRFALSAISRARCASSCASETSPEAACCCVGRVCVSWEGVRVSQGGARAKRGAKRGVAELGTRTPVGR